MTIHERQAELYIENEDGWHDLGGSIEGFEMKTVADAQFFAPEPFSVYVDPGPYGGHYVDDFVFAARRYLYGPAALLLSLSKPVPEWDPNFYVVVRTMPYDRVAYYTTTNRRWRSDD